MSNIVSFSDINDQKEDNDSVFSFVGGHKSAIQVENNPGENNHTTVELYKDGFIVDGGEFRSLDDPKNKKFIKEIQQGIAPKELSSGDSEVCVQLVDRQSVCYQRKPEERAESKSRRFEKYDKIPGNKRIINLKLYTGESVSLEISESASLGDLLLCITNISGLEERQFTLLSDYPPKPISYDHSTLLSATGNMYIIQICFLALLFRKS